MKLTQEQAQRLVGAKLKKDHPCGLPAGTPCSLQWIRSALDRPRYLGGRLTHEFEASCALPGAQATRLQLRDRDLVDFVHPEQNSSFTGR